jgi:transitional endoplasmic reticulum ATPase
LRPVAEADDEGGEPARHERLAGLRLAQRLAAPGNTLLLFDEAEDLFVRRGGGGFDEPVASSRVFMHRLLERMAVPAIWTANDIGVLGPAVVRRMTMCLELKIPNLVTRTRLPACRCVLGTSKNTPSARPANQIQRISLNLTPGSGCDGAIGFL